MIDSFDLLNILICRGAAIALGIGVSLFYMYKSTYNKEFEIGSLFFAMAVGLAIGTGYVTFAIIFTLIIGLSMIMLQTLSFREEW